MRNLILISLLVVLGIAANAQAGYQTFTADTTKGAQTKYITSTVATPYMGLASFEFTLKGFAASDDIVVTLQGSNDSFTKVFDVDTTTYSATTVNSYVMIDNPAKYLKYRLKLVGASGDTVRVYNPIFIYKR